MDFAKQCRRFLNFQILDKINLSYFTFEDISAIDIFKNTQKAASPSGAQVGLVQSKTLYRIVFIDNQTRTVNIINESDGLLIKQVVINEMISYGLCCTEKTSQNTIYVSDYANNIIRKFDENLNELRHIELNASDNGLSGPTGLAINNELKQLHAIDQKNCRVVFFDLASDAYVGEMKLFESDLDEATRFLHSLNYDLAHRHRIGDHIEHIRDRMKLDFWPFGLCTKGDRVYVTDWCRGCLYIYKNGELERKIEDNKKLFIRPRNILLDSLDSILVTDLEKSSFFFLDNKGLFLFETKPPKKQDKSERGIFGVARYDNKLIYATNCSIYICSLSKELK
jgi:hypothetical protein